MNVRALASKLVAPVALVLLTGGSPVSAATDTYHIDPVHSAVLFRISHFGAGHVYGRFNAFTGSIAIDEATPANSSVKVEVKVDSVDTGAVQRDQHLKTPDFFNAAQFPTITFASTAVAKGEGNMYDVTGNLTLHGVTKSITVKMEKSGPGKDKSGNTLLGFEGTFTLIRSEYGMTGYLPGVGDEVRMTLAFEGMKK